MISVPCNSDRNQGFEYRKDLWWKEVTLDGVGSKRSLCFAGNASSEYGSSLLCLAPFQFEFQFESERT